MKWPFERVVVRIPSRCYGYANYICPNLFQCGVCLSWPRGVNPKRVQKETAYRETVYGETAYRETSRTHAYVNYDVAKERIQDFLKTYYQEHADGHKVFVYADQAAEVAYRRQTAFYVMQEDVHTHDPELSEWIDSNTCRFRNLFYEVTDAFIQEILGDNEPPVHDAHDAFIFQRLYMDRKIKEADGEMVSHDEMRKKYPPELMRRYEIYFKTRDLVKPLPVRELKASCVGKLVSVRGVCIRSTEVKPLANVITYTCDACGNETYQPVAGQSYTPAFNCPSRDCVESKANGRLQMQVRGSKFIKFQEIRIQEISDQVPVGSIPRSMTISLTGENTRKAMPGDTVVVSGVLIPALRSGFKQVTGGLVTEIFLDAHHVENSRDENEDLLNAELTEEEIQTLGSENVYERLAYSIAPEIYGLLDEKKSLLLALVGGVDKNASGMKIRGALNILMMGDPGVAKSQLLGYVDRLAIRSQYTTGRGSSGVGLTAAVVKDPITGEYALEGGSLVLADRGICCIDEFDKMLDSDRTAIHEVMEQQTISIAKAGIMTSLNARVSIIAAANPSFGRYNPHRSIEENLRLPAALLSRFDLLWLIQDVPNIDSDKRLAEHITYVHRKGEQPQCTFKPIEMVLFRKYIALCKRKQPTIPEPLKQRLVEMYVDIRRDALNDSDSIFTSPRILLGAIRLSTALARIRLSDVVSEEDVEEAIRLMMASKASLHSRQPRIEKYKDPREKAFNVIRELLQESNKAPVKLDLVYKKCNQKGFTDQVVANCISDWSEAGVLSVDSAKQCIQSIV
uniref:DNA replication licensing factor MCM7 n=1 Tax=Ditylenchus dipsaci TaxID=166011 RepID=A0A915DSI2_9BILA